MFTRHIINSVHRNIGLAPILRNFRTTFEPIRINSEGSRNVSYRNIVVAKFTLDRHEIDLHLEPKEVQEKINLENTKTLNDSIIPIIPIFTLLDTNGSIICCGPKEFNNDISNELDAKIANMSDITINFDNIEKTNNDQWCAYLNITGDFNNYVSQHRNITPVRKIENPLL